MFGVSLLRKSTITAECDQCHARFDPAQGGLCAACDRILCRTHLHGSWIRRMMVDVGARAVCVDCRRGAPTVTRARR